MPLKPKIELVHTVVVHDGLPIPEPPSVQAFKRQFHGEKVMVSYRPLSDMAHKERMFAYLHGPLLDTLAQAMLDNGTANASKDDWAEAMKDRFAKEPWYNPLTKREETRKLDFSSSKTTAAQLHTFIGQIVLFLEQEVGVEAPDSSEYKIKQRLGETKRLHNNFDK